MVCYGWDYVIDKGVLEILEDKCQVLLLLRMGVTTISAEQFEKWLPSTVDLINSRFVMERQIPRVLTLGILKLANDNLTRVDRCVYVQVVVAGIPATVKPYVIGDNIRKYLATTNKGREDYSTL